MVFQELRQLLARPGLKDGKPGYLAGARGGLRMIRVTLFLLCATVLIAHDAPVKADRIFLHGNIYTGVSSAADFQAGWTAKNDRRDRRAM